MPWIITDEYYQKKLLYYRALTLIFYIMSIKTLSLPNKVVSLRKYIGFFYNRNNKYLKQFVDMKSLTNICTLYLIFGHESI